MNIFQVDQLRPNTALDCSIYSIVNGVKLLQAGKKLTQAALETLQKRQEEEVYGLNHEEEFAVELAQESLPGVPTKQLNLYALKVGDKVLQGVYDCKDVLLWATETKQITEQDLELLLTLDRAIRGSIYVWYKDRFLLRDDPIVRAITAYFSQIQAYAVKTKRKAERKSKKELEKIAPTEKLGVYLQKPLPQERTAKEKQQIMKYYDRSLGQLDQTLRPITRAIRLEAESVRQHRHMVEDAVKMILRDCDLAMNLLNRPSDSSYLITHAFKVNLLAIEVATAMDLSKQEIVNIGLAANLQDLGMLCLPKTLVNKTTPLTPSELQEIRRHPIYSIEVLEKAKGLPEDVQKIVLQAHERPDGSGYPAGLSGGQMYHLAKILSAVNVYVAMISPRPYRPALATYDAVFFLLQNAHHHLLDRDIVKTLLGVLSLFPIGTLVELNTGEIARVVSANEGAYTRPVVSVIYDGDHRLRPPPRFIDLLDADGLEIVRIVSPDEFPQVDMNEGF